MSSIRCKSSGHLNTEGNKRKKERENEARLGTVGSLTTLFLFLAQDFDQ